MSEAGIECYQFSKDVFVAESFWKGLIPQADALECRCANEWDASTQRRRQY